MFKSVDAHSEIRCSLFIIFQELSEIMGNRASD